MYSFTVRSALNWLGQYDVFLRKFLAHVKIIIT